MPEIVKLAVSEEPIDQAMKTFVASGFSGLDGKLYEILGKVDEKALPPNSREVHAIENEVKEGVTTALYREADIFDGITQGRLEIGHDPETGENLKGRRLRIPRERIEELDRNLKTNPFWQEVLAGMAEKTQVEVAEPVAKRNRRALADRLADARQSRHGT